MRERPERRDRCKRVKINCYIVRGWKKKGHTKIREPQS